MDIYQCTLRERRPYCFSSFIDQAWSFCEQRRHTWNPPLHIAVREDHTDIAVLLIKHGASVNNENLQLEPDNLPLYIAIRKGHTDMALSLIKHGASVKQHDGYGDLPLHAAVREGHTNLALSLIEHGASVNQQNKGGKMPIAYYFNKDKEQLNDQLFTRLIPANSKDILKAICNMVQQMTERNPELLSWGLLQLTQHFVVMEPLTFAANVLNAYVTIHLNKEVLFRGRNSFKAAYLCSVLLILSGCDVSFPNAIVPQLNALSRARYLSGAQSIEDLWNMYKEKDKVKRLHTLCIQKTRQFMHNLTDESFQSLPVPNYILKFLMLHDVADVLCQAFLMWPKCIPIEDFM